MAAKKRRRYAVVGGGKYPRTRFAASIMTAVGYAWKMAKPRSKWGGDAAIYLGKRTGKRKLIGCVTRFPVKKKGR